MKKLDTKQLLAVKGGTEDPSNPGNDADALNNGRDWAQNQ
jgi:hypothetical protein